MSYTSYVTRDHITAAAAAIANSTAAATTANSTADAATVAFTAVTSATIIATAIAVTTGVVTATVTVATVAASTTRITRCIKGTMNNFLMTLFVLCLYYLVTAMRLRGYNAYEATARLSYLEGVT